MHRAGLVASGARRRVLPDEHPQGRFFTGASGPETEGQVTVPRCRCSIVACLIATAWPALR